MASATAIPSNVRAAVTWNSIITMSPIKNSDAECLPAPCGNTSQNWISDIADTTSTTLFLVGGVDDTMVADRVLWRRDALYAIGRPQPSARPASNPIIVSMSRHIDNQ